MSQTSAILDYLADGRERTVAEIHAACGYSRLNSRVADLRKRGFDIRCRSIPGKTGSEGYAYQLTQVPVPVKREWQDDKPSWSGRSYDGRLFEVA